MNTQPPQFEQPALPADRFYWAVLDTSLLPRRLRRNPRQLGFLFESVLPVPLDDVHAVYLHPLGVESGAQRAIGCGLAKAELDQRDARAIVLSPRELPAFIREATGQDVNALQFNLLVGLYEPTVVRRARARFAWLASLILLAAAMLVSAGLLRRARGFDAASESTSLAQRQIYKSLLSTTDSAAPAGAGQPDSLRLTAELRRLRQTRRQDVEAFSSENIAIVMEQLLEHWPLGLHLQTESITVADSTISINVQLPSSDDAQKLTDALAAMEQRRFDQPGVRSATWQLQQPRFRAAARGREGGAAVQATILLKRIAEAPA